MTFDPLIAAPLIVQLHVAAAVAAIVLGPLSWARRSRDWWHRLFGRMWVGAMAVVAVSSFGIHEAWIFGPFSPIHLLSLLVLWSLWHGVAHARAGRRAAHAQTMRALFVWGIGLPGLFTLLPGRLMNETLFAAAPVQGFAMVAIAVSAGMLALGLWRGRAALGLSA